jgi:hypothetical protein
MSANERKPLHFITMPAITTIGTAIRMDQPLGKIPTEAIRDALKAYDATGKKTDTSCNWAEGCWIAPNDAALGNALAVAKTIGAKVLAFQDAKAGLQAWATLAADATAADSKSGAGQRTEQARAVREAEERAKAAEARLAALEARLAAAPAAPAIDPSMASMLSNPAVLAAIAAMATPKA